jgi:hypothetical protein
MIVDGTSELGPHRSLTGGRAQDQPNTFDQLLVAVDERNPTLGVAPHGKGKSSADEIVVHRLSSQLIITFGEPITMGAPHPAISPIRSAGRPPRNTFGLPMAKGVGG